MRGFDSFCGHPFLEGPGPGPQSDAAPRNPTRRPACTARRNNRGTRHAHMASSAGPCIGSTRSEARTGAVARTPTRLSPHSGWSLQPSKPLRVHSAVVRACAQSCLLPTLPPRRVRAHGQEARVLALGPAAAHFIGGEGIVAYPGSVVVVEGLVCPRYRGLW